LISGPFPRPTESQANRRTGRRTGSRTGAALGSMARVIPLVMCLLSCARPAAAPAGPEPNEPVAQSAMSTPRPEPRSEVQQGYATWYGRELAGHRTADGELFDPREMTAAHRTLPFGTWVEVICLDTGRRVRVRITDRGPFGHSGRIIDLSRAAADRLGIRSRGVAFVAVRVVSGP
jgi:peptidoglycan lytic transglycosylase